MRKIIIALLLSTASLTLAQNPEIKTDLPTITPPSPTVAALMKFEEVPVSNYTGVPDISIPLFSTPTHSKDLGVNIALKYHSGVGANDVAGEVGLGWSLITGGTISRVVRGLPDEQLVLDGNQDGSGKVGLYHTSLSNHNNYYYEHGDNFSNFVTQNSNEANKYLWDATELGKYDTEHDLWQFNFMGNSGRFLIKKDIVTGLLSVQPLDDFRIKIINNYVTIGNNNYVPSGFTVYDERGYKYIFDAIETTLNSQAVYSEYVLTFPTSLSAEREFRSAFHLSKVYDNNNVLLIEYLFNPSNEFIECSKNSTLTSNDYSQISSFNNLSGYQMMGKFNCYNEFKPIKSTVNSYSKTTTRKIQTIKIVDRAKVDINYLQGREDTNIQLPAKAVYIDQIIIKKWNDTIVNKFKLEYDYSSIIENRMILIGVTELNSTNQVKNKHELFYKTNSSVGYNVGRDYWGYFNLTPQCKNVDVNFSNEPTPSFSTTDVLQKIKFPTGGCAIFNFESNTYSYIGAQTLSNFDENPNNYHQTYYNPAPTTFTNSNTTYLIPVSTVTRKVTFSPSISTQNQNPLVDTFILQKLVNGTWTAVTSLNCYQYPATCCLDLTLEANLQYRIFRSFTSTDPTPNATIGIQYFEKNNDLKEFLYGGGNRIKNIGYFEEDVPQNYYDDTNIQNSFSPIKQKNFNYSLPTNTNKSSGSLAFLKPLFQYDNSIKMSTSCVDPPYYSGTTFDGIIHFITRTTFNNYSSIKTQGADVGYKNVSVYETGNGYSEYEYTSPLDYPEEVLVVNEPPFLPSKNFDYKRGLLLKEVVKDSQLRELQEVNYSYSFENFEFKYGLRLHKPEGECFGPASYFGNYQNYIPHVQEPQGPVTSPSTGMNSFSDYNLCGYPSSYLEHYPLIQAYGWAKLTSKTNKSYFYDSSNNQNVVQTTETYQYNPINKQISESTVTNSNQGEVLKTKYFYHTGNSSYSQNRIAEIEKIETYRGSELLSTSQINYTNNWSGNASYLPQSIVTSKGNATLENRLIYELYDEYSNPLQFKQEGGTIVSYIWGYNQTQPIAKIENATYAQVSSYVSNLQTLSNGTDEANLIIALNALRTALPNAMITTLTYIPLVGVHTITDPKGDIQTYEYDTFGRLKAVYDKDGYKLVENDYHYKTQN